MKVVRISRILGRQILDSRGNPTVEADVYLENGLMGRAAVPSGASTDKNEAMELRDNDPKVYLGKGVLKAVANINNQINKVLKGFEINSQQEIDEKMIELDGTDNKVSLGANAILAVSLASAKAAAQNQNLPLYQYFANLSGNTHLLLPIPMINIINGGAHASFATDIQEFMIMPIDADNFSQALQVGSEIFHALAKVLKKMGYPTTTGDEGGYALSNYQTGSDRNTEALELIKQAVEDGGYKLGEDVVLGLDVAASELYQDGKYILKASNQELDTGSMIDTLIKYSAEFPIVSIEDGLAQSDWAGWTKLTKKIGDKMQIVGDDLFVTNIKFLEKGIQTQAANAILVKPNQIGTLSETIKTVQMAKQAGWKIIISHRSGETEDTTIAHLSVGLGTGQIKTGSMSRTDRVAKYNELLRIEEQLGENAQ